MHDRSKKNSGENSSVGSENKHDHPQWVNKYLDLADTALEQDDDDREQRPAA